MPSYGGEVTLSTCGAANFNSVIALLDGPDCEHLNCLVDSSRDGNDCDSVGASITFTARQEYYFVMVTGLTVGAAGDFELTITTGLPSEPLPCPGYTLVSDSLSSPVQLSGTVEMAGGFSDVAPLDEFQTSSLIFQQIQTTTDFPAFFNMVNADDGVPGGSRVLSVEVYYSPPYSPVISAVGYGDWGITTSVNSAVMTRLLYFGDAALNGDGSFVQTGLGGYDATLGGTANAFRFTGLANAEADLVVTCIDMDGVAGSVPITVIGVANSRSYVISYDDLQPGMGPRVDFTNLGSIVFAFVCGYSGMEATWDYISFAHWTQPTAITYNVCEISNNHYTMDWYRFDLTHSGAVSINTCNAQTTFPTAIAVATGGCPNFVCVDVEESPCSNQHFQNGQLISFTPSIPGDDDFASYYISISTAELVSGNYMMEVVQEASSADAPGATCNVAIELELGMTTISNSGSVYENLCGLDTSSPSVWLSYTAPYTGSLVLSTCTDGTNFDTVIAVVDTCESLTCIASNDDTPCNTFSGASAVSVNLTGGQQVFIAVAGYQSASGTAQLISTYSA